MYEEVVVDGRYPEYLEFNGISTLNMLRSAINTIKAIPDELDQEHTLALARLDTRTNDMTRPGATQTVKIHLGPELNVIREGLSLQSKDMASRSFKERLHAKRAANLLGRILALADDPPQSRSI